MIQLTRRLLPLLVFHGKKYFFRWFYRFVAAIQTYKHSFYNNSCLWIEISGYMELLHMHKM